MKCPACGHGEHRVMRTDAADGVVRRARECIDCGKRWHTIEAPETVYQEVELIKEVMRRAFAEIEARGSITRTALYRHFSEAGLLLYVGISEDEPRRREQHRRASPWFHLVARTTVDPFPSKEDALEAERAAIRDERPKFNRMGRR